MTSTIWIGLALGSIAALVIGLGAYGAACWADRTRMLLVNLEDSRVPATTTRYDAREPLFAIGLVAGGFEEVGWTGYATPGSRRIRVVRRWRC